MRAIELLNQSKLPHNMELLEEKKLLEIERNQLFIDEMNRLQRELSEKEKHNSSIRKTHQVPDYDELYKKFTIEMETKKAVNRKNTRTVPFVLKSASRTGCRKGCAHKDHLNQSQVKFNRSNSSMSRLSKINCIILKNQN